MDDDDDQIDGVFDIHVLEKERQPLYEGSKTSLLYTILLLVNLKVMDGFSNTYVTQLLRYVINFFTSKQNNIRHNYEINKTNEMLPC